MKYTNRLIRSISAVLSAAVVLMCIQPSGIRAEEINVKYYSVEETNSFEVEPIVSSKWNGHANVNLMIKNTGEEKIDNWYITFSTPYTIENVWNGSLVDRDDKGTYTFKNDGWNQDILPGESVVLSMTLDLNDQESISFPKWYLLNTKSRELPSDHIAYEYVEYFRWEEGFSGALQLSSGMEIEDWSVAFRSEYEILSVENAVLDTVNDGTYVMRNDLSDQNLRVGFPITLQITGLYNENDFNLDIIKIETETLVYHLEEDEDSNGIPDYVDFIKSVDNEAFVTPTPEPTVIPEPTAIITEEPTTVPEPTVSDETYDWIDTDNDGLSDEEEQMFGTEPNNPDTDGDGIGDYLEITIGFDPLSIDSDGNGIVDGDEDFDGDGITNKTEIEAGTCIFATDSDYDGINDYDELYVYGTDPESEDSNGDGIADGDAVTLGLDPSKTDTDGDGIPDNEERFYQEKYVTLSDSETSNAITAVEVKGEFTNLLSSTMTIEDTYGNDVYSSAIEALVGGLVSIETTSDFDSATLMFHYDENKLGDTEEDNLCILWYDEANNKYVMFDQEQVLDKENNTLSLDTTHFCSVMVIDKSKWVGTWKKSIDKYLKARDEYEKEHSVSGTKYIFAVQLSSTDSMNFRIKEYEACSKLMSKFSDDEVGGFLVYSGIAYGHCQSTVSWYTQYLAVNLYNSVDMNPASITQAFSCASDIQALVAEEDDPVVLYLFTDQTSSFKLSDEDVEQINRNGSYKVNIISVGGTEKTVASTGNVAATILPCNNIDGFLESADDQIVKDKQGSGGDDWQTLDTDGDGLFDYQEEAGFILSNGNYVTTSPEKKDTDDDEISDLEELGNRCQFGDLDVAQQEEFNQNLSYHSECIECWDMISDPTKKDSDGDTFDDNEDAIPLLINSDKIYVFALQDFADQGKRLKNAYKEAGLNVSMDTFNDTDTFVRLWSYIGMPNYSADAVKDGKYYYNVTNVVVATHGEMNVIVTGTGSSQERLWATFTFNENISILSDKKVDTLNLYACSCAKNYESDETIAEDFLNTFSMINNVVAFDTVLINYFTDSDYHYFGRWYEEKMYVDKEEYDLLKLTNQFMVLNISQSFSAPMGFVKFSKRNAPIDLFNNDIVFGELKTYNGSKEGIIYKYYDYESNKYNDPILE